MIAQYFHGLITIDPKKKLEPDPTIKLLEDHFDDVYGWQHDFYKEWQKDELHSIMKEFSETLSYVDVFVGNSFGGYIAFMLAQYFEKPVIMINPALNRNFSVTGIYDADFEFPLRNIPIYMYLGYLDTTVNPFVTLNYLADKGYNNIKLQWARNIHSVPLNFLDYFFSWVRKDLGE